MKREDGVLDSVKRTDGIEMRYHVFKRNGRQVVRRIPWHLDQNGERYSGVEGPEMDLISLESVVDKES